MEHISQGPLTGGVQMLRGVRRHFLQGFQDCVLRLPAGGRDRWRCRHQRWSSNSSISPW